MKFIYPLVENQMEYMHRGVDGLDISYPVHIPEEYVELLLDAQNVAASKGKKQTHEIEINGVKLWIRPKGHSGGYAFSCTTGFFGENLYLKMPNGNDPWGLKVSVNALPLATKGLHYARTELEKKLLRLGMKVKPGDESISRIDVAVDLLVYDLNIRREHIVVPSRVNVTCYSDEVQLNGTPTKVTSVRVGSNPNRQVVIYDKQKEITETGKPYWWAIWDIRRQLVGLPPLDREKLGGARIWRTEIRFYKKYLTERMKIKTFNQLIERLPYLTRLIMRDFRLVVPSTDKNRSRWPNNPYWDRASDELLEEVLQIEPFDLTEEIREMSLGERFSSGSKQVLGLFYYLAAIRGVDERDFSQFVHSQTRELVRVASEEAGLIEDRIERARTRLMDLAPRKPQIQ